MKINRLKLLESFNNAEAISDVIDTVISSGKSKILDISKTNGYMPYPYDYYDQIICGDNTYYPKEIKKHMAEAVQWLFAHSGPAVRKYLMKLKFVHVLDAGVPTMQTDGIHIFINIGFEQMLYDQFENIKGIAYVILHEIFHNVCGHMDDMYKPEIRKKYGDHRLQNLAMDYEINYFIEHLIQERNPDTGKYENVFAGITNELEGCYDDEYAGKIWTEIYPSCKNKQSQTPQPSEKELNNDPCKIVFSDEAKKAYEDAYNKVIAEAKAKGLIK